METLEGLREFMGWCAVLNIAVLAITTISMLSFGKSMAGLHARMFSLNEADVSKMYFTYVANYKIAALVLSFVPYIALVMMT